MNGFSTVDGFVEITENVADMIKYVANEPSVGLFYIQQHTHNAVPNITTLKNNIVEKSREVTLHTEDLDDSITMTRSMKECGSSIADDMIKDIRNSLAIMSTKQPKRGLIRATNSSLGKPSSWGPAVWSRSSSSDFSQQDVTGYFSTILKSAREKASNIPWPQLESIGPLSVASSSSMLDTEGDELPLSSKQADEPEDARDDDESTMNNNFPVVEEFDDFKANKEAKFEDWLEGSKAITEKTVIP